MVFYSSTITMMHGPISIRCQNDIKPLKISNSITNNSQETAKTFSDYFLTVADIVISNIKKDNKDHRDIENPSTYLINKFTAHFQE